MIVPHIEVDAASTKVHAEDAHQAIHNQRQQQNEDNSQSHAPAVIKLRNSALVHMIKNRCGQRVALPIIIAIPNLG